MRLHFLSYAVVKNNGIWYQKQKAFVDSDPYFWTEYRRAPERVQKSLLLQKEKHNGKYKWVVFRFIPLTSGADIPELPLSYMLRYREPLYSYQQRACAYLCDSMVRNGAAADGSDTGCGKTYNALGVIREFNSVPAIVCKKAGISTWKRACKLLHIKPLFIVNWEALKNGRFPYVERGQNAFSGRYFYSWKGLPKTTMLIFDEAHMANHGFSQNSLVYRASKGIPSLSLSATFADKPGRLRSLLHILGMVNYEDFPSWMQGRGGYSIDDGNDDFEALSEEQDLIEINKLVFPKYGYRVSYEDPEVKKYFPHAVYQIQVVSVSTENRHRQNEAYRKMVDKVFAYQQLGKQADALVADLRYRQMAELMKADALVEIIQEYLWERNSVVVFVNFRETLNYLSKTLGTRCMIYGGQPDHERERSQDDFQTNKSRLILCMVEAGGSSLDLHDTNGMFRRISLICPTYNPVTLKQVMGRTHRAGGKSVPIIKLVYTAGTVEEKVADRVVRKLANISALNDGDLMEADIFKTGLFRNY